MTACIRLHFTPREPAMKPRKPCKAGARSKDFVFSRHRRQLAAESSLLEALVELEFAFGCVDPEAESGAAWAPAAACQKAALRSIAISA